MSFIYKVGVVRKDSSPAITYLRPIECLHQNFWTEAHLKLSGARLRPLYGTIRVIGRVGGLVSATLT